MLIGPPVGLESFSRKYGTVVSAVNSSSSLTETVSVWLPRGDTSLLMATGKEPTEKATGERHKERGGGGGGGGGGVGGREIHTHKHNTVDFQN